MKRNDALGKLTLRLTRMAEGGSQEIDLLLGKVRQTVKNGADVEEIAAVSDALAKAVMAATGESPDAERKLPESHDLSGLSRLVRSMPMESKEQKEMVELVRKIASGESAVERQQALGELLTSATNALREVASTEVGGKSSGGVFGGLLGKKTSGEDNSRRFLQLFADLLRRLVEHIDILNGSQQSTNALRANLESIGHVEEASSLLQEVTREIDDIDNRIRTERDKASDFLGSLRERLQNFEQIVAEVADAGGRSVERSKSLQADVGADFAGLDSAARDDDLDKLRLVLSESLTNITHRLARHVEEETTQQERAQDQVRELEEKLATLEQESEVLRSEIRSKSDLAVKDSLTGLYNRAGFEERSAELFARWQRSGAILSLVFADCNRFKQINDNYGHSAGDLVLVKIAQTLQARARVTDVLCRFGGDEFVIMLPDTPLSGAETFAHSACQEILDAGFNDNGKPLDVSISCGITQLKEGDDMASALARADEAMYEAKKRDAAQVHTIP